MITVNCKFEPTDSFDVYSVQKGGITRRISFDSKSWAKDHCTISGVDVLNDSHMVAWGCNNNQERDGGQAVGVWNPLLGALKAGYVKAQDPIGAFRRGCVINEATAFLTTNVAACTYSTELGFMERKICQVDYTNSFSWVMPRNVTPTGPATVLTGNDKGYVDIWDTRSKLTTPSRSIPTGFSTISQVSWHPAAPDLIACCDWRSPMVRVFSLASGDEVARFQCSSAGATGVGFYKDTLAVGTGGGVEFFKLGLGQEPIGQLIHTTVGCAKVHNVHLRHDRGIFANGEYYLCGFVY